MGGGSRPGKFPATVMEVSTHQLVLKASWEDIEYLTALIGKPVHVDITPLGSDSERYGGPAKGKG